MKSLLPSDEDLPSWLHTALLLGLVSVFGLPLIWSGAKALLTGTMLPVSGPDFGTWLISSLPLHGRAARVGGLALVVLGTAFLALGLAWTRWAAKRRLVKAVPWGLLVLALLLMRWAGALTRP